MNHSEQRCDHRILYALLGATLLVSANLSADDDEGTQIAKCSQKLGAVAINEPEKQWWQAYDLDNPEALIKLLVQRSGCFDIVDRGQGLDMRGTERDLADSGELQRNSNMGKGQVLVADYFIIPDIVSSDEDAGGSGLAGIAAGKIGGKLGGVLGGIKKKELTAHTLLSVVDARTTRNLFTSEGKYSHKDVSFGAGGFFLVGAIGGGYEDTEIGQVISAAYVEAYNDMVGRIQQMPPPSSEPSQKSYVIAMDTHMYKSASRDEPLRQIRARSTVYATGNREGIFLEVEDDFGIVGWVSVEDLSN
ncbi:MAG: hypothetical protein HKO64_10380 [Xanthomonadales bacterium]|nr:hypothetical protein [Xanthomonadales bacterium]NNL96014.1 hypothetical protein [Xanthomonadales bacterium]